MSSVGMWASGLHQDTASGQPANIALVNQLCVNCRGLDQESGDVESDISQSLQYLITG